MSGPSGRFAAAKRHVFVIRLIGQCPALQQIGLRDFQVLGIGPGVIVLDLVIVPRHDPRHGGMHGQQRRIAAVLSVSIAIIVERFDLAADMLPHSIVARRTLVDVIAQVQNQIQVIFQHMLVRGVKAGLEMLTRRECEPQRGRGGIRRRHGAGAPLGLVSVPALN